MRRTAIGRTVRRGSVLGLVVIMIVIFFMIGTAILTLGFNSRIFAIRTEADIAAHCAADAGLTKALREMNHQLTITPFSLPPPEKDVPMPNCDAFYSYTITKSGSYYYAVDSNGTCGEAVRKVHAILELRGVGDTCMLVRKDMTLYNNVYVDSRDSRDPTIELTGEAQIRTASAAEDSMTLYNGVVVDGDVLVGFGCIDVNDAVKDQGATDPYGNPLHYATLDEDPYFPPVTPPGLPVMGKIAINPNDEIRTIQIGPSGSGEYSSIILKNATEPAILEIVGGHVILYITGDIWLGQECEIRIAKDASLDLYVSGNIKSDEGSGFNNLGLPSDLKLWGLAHDPLSETPLQEWDIKAKSAYFGQVYAPEATIQVNAKGELWGAFTAYSLTMNNAGNLYYDVALRAVEPDDPGVRFGLKRWRED